MLLLALEARAWLEAASLVPALPLLRAAPRGDGHPVLVLPGFMAGDASTAALRTFLRDRGYRAHAWRLGRNLGPTDDVVGGLVKRLAEMRQRYDRKVSLVGWSLGGIYARELARHFPDHVRQVVTIASPFRNPTASNVPRLPGLRARLPRTSPDAEMIARLGEPLTVPSTAIWSRSDGIVAGESCRELPGPLRESIEIVSSHCGMGHHPATLLVVADRLAQAEGDWRPLAASSWLGWLLRHVA